MHESTTNQREAMEESNAMQIVLDADGVFMSERPYWRAALATSLWLLSEEFIEPASFRVLYNELFDIRKVHHKIKALGVNSNWHMAVALYLSLGWDEDREAVFNPLRRYEVEEAAAQWESAIEHYTGTIPTLCEDGESITAFLGDQPIFQRMLTIFQRIIHGADVRFDVSPTYETLGDTDATRQTFEKLCASGFPPAICTGRPLIEILEPLTEFGLLDSLGDKPRLVTHDEVLMAENQTGMSNLSKPHWYPLALAVAGEEASMAALTNDGPKTFGFVNPCIFVGDSRSDFDSLKAYIEMGGQGQFIFADAGTLPEDKARSIAEDPITLGTITEFSQLPALLCEKLRKAC